MQLENIKELGRGYFQAQAAALRPEVRMVIDGELTEAASGRRFETINPATDEIIASVPLGDAEEVDRAAASARRAFREGLWSRMEPRKRAEVLYCYAELIEENGLELALLDTLDVGKPIVDTLTGDVPAAALTLRYFGEAIDKFDGLATSTAADEFHHILREPLGVVACILPWNYPLLIGAWKFAPALAMGSHHSRYAVCSEGDVVITSRPEGRIAGPMGLPPFEKTTDFLESGSSSLP
jgi:acyl-CoA reductase-like NAD-dependent aldehyde dehydrogenase